MALTRQRLQDVAAPDLLDAERPPRMYAGRPAGSGQGSNAAFLRPTVNANGTAMPGTLQAPQAPQARVRTQAPQARSNIPGPSPASGVQAQLAQPPAPQVLDRRLLINPRYGRRQDGQGQSLANVQNGTTSAGASVVIIEPEMRTTTQAVTNADRQVGREQGLTDMGDGTMRDNAGNYYQWNESTGQWEDDAKRKEALRQQEERARTGHLTENGDGTYSDAEGRRWEVGPDGRLRTRTGRAPTVPPLDDGAGESDDGLTDAERRGLDALRELFGGVDEGLDAQQEEIRRQTTREALDAAGMAGMRGAAVSGSNQIGQAHAYAMGVGKMADARMAANQQRADLIAAELEIAQRGGDRLHAERLAEAARQHEINMTEENRLWDLVMNADDAASHAFARSMIEGDDDLDPGVKRSLLDALDANKPAADAGRRAGEGIYSNAALTDAIISNPWPVIDDVDFFGHPSTQGLLARTSAAIRRGASYDEVYAILSQGARAYANAYGNRDEQRATQEAVEATMDALEAAGYFDTEGA